MTGLLTGLFKDPENDRRQLVELVAAYAQDVPELLPALHDVVRCGVLYDEKLAVFVDLLKGERKRRRRLSGGEGYETDYPEDADNVSVPSADTTFPTGSSVKKKKKKKKHSEQADLAEDEAKEKNEADERDIVIDKTEVYPLEDVNNEESPPVKKKKKKHKKEPSQDDVSLRSVESQSPLVNGNSAVNVVGENSSVGHVVAKNEAKKEEDPDESNLDKNILINTVGGEQNGIRCSTPSMSNIEKTPRKRNISALGLSPSTPFRVIPSVQLMEDPTRFPDLVPSPAQPAVPETVSGHNWRVSFEFGSSFVENGILTAADVCSALEHYGLKHVRVMQLEESDVGTHSATVEFFCNDFLSAASQFPGLHSAIEDGPRIVGVCRIIGKQSSEDSRSFEPRLGELASTSRGVTSGNSTAPQQPAGPLKLEEPRPSLKLTEQLITLNPGNQLDAAANCNGRPGTSSRPRRDAVAFQSLSQPTPDHHRQSVDTKLRKLLESMDGTQHCSYFCLMPHKVQAAMHQFLPAEERGAFMRWMDVEKARMLENPSLIPKHVLFRGCSLWFAEFDRQQHNLPSQKGEPKYRPRNGYRGSRGRGNRRYEGRRMR